jgi:MoaA/NifB/PqqE/SkfB family radical SAM enzyme
MNFPIYCEVDTTTECNGTLGCTLYCTYRDKHTKGIVLDYDLGCYFFNKVAELGVRGVLFSGGGENLENCSYDRFLSLLKYAKKVKKLHTSLATNGRYLSFDRIQELSLYLDSLRISIPPIREDYCHAGLIAPSVTSLRKIIRNLTAVQAEHGAGKFEPMKIIINILMSPKMPQSELESLIRMFSQMGVDGIRLKPMHEFQNDGTFKVRPNEYIRHLETVRSLISDERLRRPDITIAKIEGMLAHDSIPRTMPKYCWYRDFNPLVLGADGHLYACCEMKYEKPPFDKGHLVAAEDNLFDLLGDQETPHPITKGNCFEGCKGYLPNIDLQLLLDRYKGLGEAIFEHSETIAARDRVLASLPRTVLAN